MATMVKRISNTVLTAVGLGPQSQMQDDTQPLSPHIEGRKRRRASESGPATKRRKLSIDLQDGEQIRLIFPATQDTGTAITNSIDALELTLEDVSVSPSPGRSSSPLSDTMTEASTPARAKAPSPATLRKPPTPGLPAKPPAPAVSAKTTTPQPAIDTTNEPEYSKRDTDIREEIWSMMSEMQAFAEKWFKSEQNAATTRKLSASGYQARFFEMCHGVDVDFVRIVGCIAAGGPNAEEGWKELFFNDQPRQALVCGIIGNVLVEQVFAHMLFGATTGLRKKIESVQHDLKYSDGFARTEKYAETIRKELPSGRLPANFEEHARHIAGSLFALLEPILPLVGYQRGYFDKAKKEAIVFDLWNIVTHAGFISVAMRLDGKAVYYWVPTLKDDRYDAKTMECFNSKEMVDRHPRSGEWLKAADPAEVNRARGDEGLIRVNCMNGCTVYRKGGWGEAKYANRGIRSRQLTQNWVLCRWGRQRRWKNGKPDDSPAAHGPKWRDPGFLEFREVVESTRYGQS